MIVGIDLKDTHLVASVLKGDKMRVINFGFQKQHYEVPLLVARSEQSSGIDYYGFEAQLKKRPEFVLYKDSAIFSSVDIFYPYLDDIIAQLINEHSIIPTQISLAVSDDYLTETNYTLEVLNSALDRLKEKYRNIIFSLVGKIASVINGFLYRYRSNYQKDYRGYLILSNIDQYKTDLSLVYVDANNEFKIVNTASNNQISVYHYAKDILNNLNADNEEYSQRLMEKLSVSSEINCEILERFSLSNIVSENSDLFIIDDYIITASSMCSAYYEVMSQELIVFLKKFISETNREIDDFRFLSIDTISLYPFVKADIRKSFDSILSGDKRFDDLLSISEKNHAVSQGAITVGLTPNDLLGDICPISLGINVYQITQQDELSHSTIDFLRKGTPISFYQTPSWSSCCFVMLQNNIRLSLVVEDSYGKIEKINELKTLDLLPSKLSSSNDIFHIGFSINNGFVFIHIKDSLGVTKLTDISRYVSI